MVEHHSTTPARTPDEIDLPLAATPVSGQRHSIVDRLDALERTVREVGEILTMRLPPVSQESNDRRSGVSELAVEVGGAFRSLMGELEELRGSVEALRSSAGDEAATLRERIREEVDRGTQQLGKRLEQAADSIQRLPEQLSEEVGPFEAVRTLAAWFGDGMAAISDSMAEVAAAHAGIEQRLAILHQATSEEAARARLDEIGEVLGARLGEAAGSMRWDVQEVLAGVRKQLTGLTEEVAAVRSEVEQRSSALQEGLERVDKLAEAVETIGRRRSFKKIVESDLRVREEQAAMTERLAESGRTLSAQAEGVRAELKELERTARDTQAGALAEEVRRRVVDELVTEELVQQMVQRVKETLDQKLQELAGRMDSGWGWSASILPDAITSPSQSQESHRSRRLLDLWPWRARKAHPPQS